MRALVVEDDRHLASALEHILARAGYQCDAVHDGETGFAYAESGAYDVIIFDVMLPKLDGFSAVERLRARDIGTPVLMLTAKSRTSDKIDGLDSGADSYMTKPFSPSELLARLRALTRRVPVSDHTVLEAVDLRLDPQTHDLSCGTDSVTLGNKELRLARLLIANAGAAVPKQRIGEVVWSEEGSFSSNNLEAYVSMLRKKLRFLGSTAQIRYVSPTGYCLAGPEGDAPC